MALSSPLSPITEEKSDDFHLEALPTRLPDGPSVTSSPVLDFPNCHLPQRKLRPRALFRNSPATSATATSVTSATATSATSVTSTTTTTTSATTTKRKSATLDDHASKKIADVKDQVYKEAMSNKPWANFGLEVFQSCFCIFLTN